MSRKPLPPIASQAHREQISSLPLVEELAGILTILSIGYCPIYASPDATNTSLQSVVRTKPQVIGWRELNRDDTSRYSLLLKSVEAALRKVLPDLKSIEVNDRSESRRTLTDQELAQRISGVLSEVAERAPHMVTPPTIN